MEKLIWKKDGTVKRVTLTAEEEAARNADIAKVKAEDDERNAAKEVVATQKATDAKAGNDKLIALGLTQDQVTAMTGFVPLSVQYQNLIDAGKTAEEATTLTGYTPPAEQTIIILN